MEKPLNAATLRTVGKKETGLGGFGTSFGVGDLTLLN